MLAISIFKPWGKVLIYAWQDERVNNWKPSQQDPICKIDRVHRVHSNLPLNCQVNHGSKKFKGGKFFPNLCCQPFFHLVTHNMLTTCNNAHATGFWSKPRWLYWCDPWDKNYNSSVWPRHEKIVCTPKENSVTNVQETEANFLVLCRDVESVCLRHLLI